jgi:hypothetical protein
MLFHLVFPAAGKIYPICVLASAYQDLVDIPSGGLEEIDPAPYKGRLPEARTKVVQYYSAAINFDPNSTIAKIS